ncbi:hypothetical protein D3C78_1780260 [compost metagenome]
MVWALPSSSLRRWAATESSARACTPVNASAAIKSMRISRMDVLEWIQSRIGAGAMTSRVPLVFIGVTTPAISMASIIRAARL